MSPMVRKRSVVALMLTVLGCATLSPSASAAPYKAERLGLQFEMPSGWSTEGEIGRAILDEPILFVLPDSKEESSSNDVGISVISHQLKSAGAKDLSQVGAYFRSINTGRDYTLVSEEDTTIGGLPAKQIVFVDTLTGIAEKVRHRETYVFHKGRLLKIDFTATESHFEAQWRQAKGFFDSLGFIS